MQFIILILLQAIQIYYYILIAYIVLSWIPVLFHTMFGRLVIYLVRPILLPFRRLNLQFFGLDWTIFLVMILLNVASHLLSQLIYLV